MMLFLADRLVALVPDLVALPRFAGSVTDIMASLRDLLAGWRCTRMGFTSGLPACPTGGALRSRTASNTLGRAGAGLGRGAARLRLRHL